MSYSTKKHEFPVVTAEQRIFLKSKQNFYDYARSLLEPIGFKIDDYSEIEYTDSVEQREWDQVSKFTVDHYVKVNGSWTYTCSSRRRDVDRKFRCVGGPLDGTNITYSVSRKTAEYIMFNCGERGVNPEFSAMFMHTSLMSK
jgi:hypothetical protein